MKRGLLLSMSALALTVVGSAAHAQAPVVNISLNLRYTDPGNPAAGGRWYLAVKTTDARGVAGLSAYISGIDIAGPGAPVFGSTAIGSGLAAYETVTGATLGANVTTVGGTPFNTTIGSAVNVVFGMNNAVGGAVVAGVGTATFDNDPTAATGRQENDPLRKISGGIAPQPADWNNSTILMSGGFGAARPAFVANVGPQSNNTDANILGSPTVLGTPAVDATVTLTVRGDSVSLDGLSNGDVNRDRTVNNADLTVILNNFNTAQATWDAGNINKAGASATVVNNADLTNVLNNFGTTQNPPAAGAVPEPASFALAALALAGAAGFRRRK